MKQNAVGLQRNDFCPRKSLKTPFDVTIRLMAHYYTFLTLLRNAHRAARCILPVTSRTLSLLSHSKPTVPQTMY